MTRVRKGEAGVGRLLSSLSVRPSRHPDVFTDLEALQTLPIRDFQGDFITQAPPLKSLTTWGGRTAAPLPSGRSGVGLKVPTL